MTIDLKTLGFVVLGIALLILIIYVILLIRKAIDTLKKADIVLEDCQDVSGVASTRVIQLDGAVDDLADSITGVADAFRGGQEKSKNLGAILNALGAVKNAFSSDSGTDGKSGRRMEREKVRDEKREQMKERRRERREKKNR